MGGPTWHGAPRVVGRLVAIMAALAVIVSFEGSTGPSSSPWCSEQPVTSPAQSSTIVATGCTLHLSERDNGRAFTVAVGSQIDVTLARASRLGPALLSDGLPTGGMRTLGTEGDSVGFAATLGGWLGQIRAVDLSCRKSCGDAWSVTLAVGGLQLVVAPHMVTRLIGWSREQLHAGVVRTQDGGRHWQDVGPSGTTLSIADPLVALDAERAWIVQRFAGNVTGHHGSTYTVLRTVDGGRTWSAPAPLSPVDADWQLWFGPHTVFGQPAWDTSERSPVSFADADHGWIEMTTSNAVVVLRTVDGGLTWSVVSRAERGAEAGSGGLPADCGLDASLVFISPTTGWRASEDACPSGISLYATHDGGVTWQPQGLPVLPGVPPGVVASPHLAADLPVFGTDHDGAVLVHVDDTAVPSDPLSILVLIYVTHDRGDSWSLSGLRPTISNQTYYLERAPEFTDSHHGWAEGHTDHYDAYVVHTVDGGASGVVSSVPGEPDTVDFVDDRTGFAYKHTSGVIVVTADGGRSWSELGRPSFTVEQARVPSDLR